MRIRIQPLSEENAARWSHRRGYQVESGPDAAGMFPLVRHLNETLNETISDDKGETHHAS